MSEAGTSFDCSMCRERGGCPVPPGVEGISARPEDPRIAQVLAVLPGANCGGCGFAGCAELARAVVAGEAGVEVEAA